MKVIYLTTGGLTDVWMFLSEARSKACREKSAEAIVVRIQARPGLKRNSRKSYEVRRAKPYENEQ
jgi:hypothetical protein